VRLTAVMLALVVSLGLLGCGGCGKDSSSIPSGDASAAVSDSIPTARCETGFGGTPERTWRRNATSTGPVGFYGTGRDFLSPHFTKQDKMPLIVEGHEPITLSITEQDSSHARLQAPTPKRWAPYTEIRFVPCADKARTAWAAGLLLRNRQPVTLIVRRSGEPDRMLRVGRV
jgi:hypothetical protein